MAIDDAAREREITVAGDLPDGHRSTRPPARRRRAVVAVAATVALGLVGGFLLSQRAPDQSTPGEPAAAAATPDGTATLPWVSAMVGRNGTDVTVYTGPGETTCKELWQPRVTATEQEPAQVVVAVRARVIDSVDCAVSGTAVPLAVSLGKPLGERTLRDAATGQSHPTYFERDLPDLGADERWSPYSTNWMSTDEAWHQGYNGPDGSGLVVSAQPTAAVGRPAPEAVVRIGSHQGAITGSTGQWWTVWWEAGDVTYSLRLMPREGGAFTLAQFRREIARLKWS
ncbi:hypothetical protein ACVCAH_06295 [Micromonospora sp. LZ34]